MRLFPLFKKALIENFRDWKILVIGITFAPFFVVLMYFYFGAATETYRVLFVNHDRGTTVQEGTAIRLGQELISEIETFTDQDGSVVLKISQEEEMTEAQKRLEDKSIDLIVEIPENFSLALSEYKAGKSPEPAVVRTYGDPANPRSIMAAAWSDFLAYQFALERTGMEGPLELETQELTQKESLTEFDMYVPALLGLALMMLMFTAAATLIKEKDMGTIVRLRISNMTPAEWLAAMSLVQVIIGLIALGATYLTAVVFGYEATGSLMALAVVGVVSCLALIAISVLVAAVLRTVFDLMTVGVFPFFILMFFSGGMFPIPNIPLLKLFGRSFNVNDILPTTHSITAFGKILNQGAGLEDVVFELGAVAVLAVVFFAAGVWLFTRRHMRAR